MKILNSYLKTGRALTVLSLMALSSGAQAAIDSISGPVVHLYAKQFSISTPDGDSFRMWGFADGENGIPQYPGPTIRADQGQLLQIVVHNTDVPQDVSLDLLGQTGVCVKLDADPACLSGAALESAVAQTGDVNTLTYEFTPDKPGTYMYQSGVNPQVQVDMGLVGALIIDPDPTVTFADAANGTVTANGVSSADWHARGLAYHDAETAYDREYLFFLSETDPKLHYYAELGQLDNWDNAGYRSTLFFINGRNAPDTLAADRVSQLPNQPYGSLVLMHPGQRILLRVLNAGRNQHPLHLHGNHFMQVARDGNLIGERDELGNFTDLRAIEDYTYGAVQGATSDLIFNWTGKEMGWDIYGTGVGFEHTCTDTENNKTHAPEPDGYDDVSWEYCADHGKPLPVVLPENLDMAFGGFWGGSPYLGSTASLPVGEGGLNPYGGMVFMWHSHSERELTNNDIYPGGMLTMMIVFPYEANEGGPGDVD